MHYSTILFDFDGTLTHSLPMWMRAYQYALSQYGINLATEEVIGKCFYRPWRDLVVDFELPSITDFGAHVNVGLEAAMPEAVLFDDVENFLEACRLRGIKLGIVTSSTKKVVRTFIQENNLEGYFATVITADDIINFKPHPEPVFKGLAEIGGTPDTSLFVGDSSADMLAAEAAGLHKALFLPDEHLSFYDFTELRNHEPHLVFHKYSEILSRLEAVPHETADTI